jgi:hypothetical protein
MTATCSSCGAPVHWCRTTSGKAIPLDAAPDPEGNLVAVDRAGVALDPTRALAAVSTSQATVVVARRALRSIDPRLPHWRTHFATCPNAERHRARRVATKPHPADTVQDSLPL